MSGEQQPASQEPESRQTEEFQNFANALRKIMAVRKDDLDLGPVRQRKGRRTSPKGSKVSE